MALEMVSHDFLFLSAHFDCMKFNCCKYLCLTIASIDELNMWWWFFFVQSCHRQ